MYIILYSMSLSMMYIVFCVYIYIHMWMWYMPVYIYIYYVWLLNDISINQQPGSHRGAGEGPDRFGGTGSTLDDSTTRRLIWMISVVCQEWVILLYLKVYQLFSMVCHGLSWFILRRLLAASIVPKSCVIGISTPTRCSSSTNPAVTRCHVFSTTSL